MKKLILVILFMFVLTLSGCQYLPGGNSDISSMELIGEAIMTVEINSSFEDPGIYARDKSGTPNGYVIIGEVEISTLGSYLITYRQYHDSKDKDIYIEITRVVRVVDTTPPVIEITGDAVNMKVGESYVEPGFNVSDNSLEDLVATINVTFDETSPPGRYFVYYRAEDSSGNFTVETRSVFIQE